MSAIEPMYDAPVASAASRLGTLEPRRAPSTDEPAVVLECSGGSSSIHRFHQPESWLSAALEQLMRSRREWFGVPGTGQQVQTTSRQVLEYLGCEGGLAAIAAANIVQVVVSADAPRPVLDFPWEFVLAEATRPIRRTLAAGGAVRPFLVFRHLESQPPPVGPVPAATPTALLVVESAPGGLQSVYGFDAERRLVESSLALENNQVLAGPDSNELRTWLTNRHPAVIHLTGIDARQGHALLTRGSYPAGPTTTAEGMYFEGENEPEVIPFKTLAEILVAGGDPRLVGFNLYNSANGAAEAVRHGADAAIGVQYDIDDSLAELFFGSFYAAWRRSGWDVLAGFRDAFAGLGLHGDKVRGTGIVLWTKHRLIGSGTGDGTRRRGRRPDTGTGAGDTGVPVTPAATTPATIEHLPGEVANPADHIEIEYQWPTALNYSMLHNDDRVVPRLVIRRQKPGTFRAISVEVVVQAGAEQAVYRETVTLDDVQPRVDLHERIRVPLTSELTRRLDESLRSTIYVAVRWGQHVLLERTDPVSFMPVDEWRYDEMNARWLPSFVFPRDPVIRDVITAAQRYLVALRDDGAAGFDGYQSYDGPGQEPLAERARNVDAQVQAIWWALVNDYALGYINPPPSFSASAQRLRTPSETLGGKRGTCIDLALLLVACLEYVEIYPVIFMLTDHAFPGYWRSPESYEQLGKLLTASQVSEANTQVPMRQRDNHGDPWMLGRERFAEITRLVGQGHLVPIESVDITSRSGFWPAVDNGIANLRSRRQFDSLYDLLAARKKVTPLPIWSKRP